ncbi:GNAT family N-acetyltransferase [Pontibacter ramchanderi]|uniref:Putative N-acetyltransferase YhbS n=1 Tax=Pontibacter ramchanderi TaxID=1179743 RepID=A0A2N3U7B9_9BACT|nr:N-acetyltransferase [Pontibacter ramchanderi]PKV62643.1 putative N-acetyltransferase YhbS [Pontibacter ramchanderi]
MPIQIRQEQPADYPAVFALVEQAFRDLVISDHTEQFLVERLRKSNAFIPELSLVAVDQGKIVGYILLTKLKIKNHQQEFESLSLAPVAVLPTYHRQGIGAMLMEQAHLVAKDLGYTSVILVGHEQYYPRSGYKPASTFGIRFPFEVPDANAMAVELVENGLAGISGEVVYPKEFF